MRPILVIARHFPPGGGPGVQRTLKFVRYLPAFGFLPVVLTVIRESSSMRWSPEDASLLDEVPAEIPIYRAAWPGRTRSDRGVFASLVARANDIVSRHRPSLIYVSMSPFQDAEVAATLASANGIPWVADLRDPWALDEFQIYRSRLHRWSERRRMRKALASAALVILNTREAERRYRQLVGPDTGQRITSITNGFDRDDFADLVSDSGVSERFTIVHSGSLHTESGLRCRNRRLEYRLLGRLEAGVDHLPRSHYFLLKALSHLVTAQPSMATRIRVVLAGIHRPADQAVIEQSPVGSLVECTGYLTHRESIRRLLSGDVLFLPMHSVAAGRRASIVPGKLYEYMASGRPILGAVPDGDARDFLTACGTAAVCNPDDVSEMTRLLRLAIERWDRREPRPTVNDAFVGQFERRLLAQDLAGHLASCVNR